MTVFFCGPFKKTGPIGTVVSLPTTVEFLLGAVPPTLFPLRLGLGVSTGMVFRCDAVAAFRLSTTFTSEGIVSTTRLLACGKLTGRAAGETAGLGCFLRKGRARPPYAKKRFIVNSLF